RRACARPRPGAASCPQPDAAQYSKQGCDSGAYMAVAAKILQIGLLTWFGLLVLLIGIRILRRDIEVAGFLSHRRDSDAVEPERALMMAVFPVVLAYYVYTAMSGDLPLNEAGRPSLPPVPDYLLSLLTGTNSLYLAGKIARIS